MGLGRAVRGRVTHCVRPPTFGRFALVSVRTAANRRSACFGLPTKLPRDSLCSSPDVRTLRAGQRPNRRESEIRVLWSTDQTSAGLTVFIPRRSDASRWSASEPPRIGDPRALVYRPNFRGTHCVHPPTFGRFALVSVRTSAGVAGTPATLGGNRAGESPASSRR
jgi:hypothetical protein